MMLANQLDSTAKCTYSIETNFHLSRVQFRWIIDKNDSLASWKLNENLRESPEQWTKTVSPTELQSQISHWLPNAILRMNPVRVPTEAR